MVEERNAKIRLLKTLFKAGGFDVLDRGNEIRVTIEKPGIARCAADFYVLRKNTEFVRVRLTNFDPIRVQEAERIEKIRIDLQEPLLGEAKIEPFSCYLVRGDTRVYYAYVEIEKDITAFTSRMRALEEVIQGLNGLGIRGFREILDGLDLPRSSVTRMALNRIFRDSSDPDDLMAAIAREARVIVSSQDWKTPRLLKEAKHLPPFLRLLSRFLWEETSRRYMIQAWEDLHK